MNTAMVPAQTIHIVTPSIILTRGVGLEVCKCEEKESKESRNNDDLFLNSSLASIWTPFIGETYTGDF